MTISALGKYEVRREIGRGSMGLVYEGFDPFIERVVALKVLRLDDVSGEDVADLKMRFRREAQAAGRLAHPNIVSIFDYGETAENHSAFIAMELVDGKDLKSLLASGRRFSFDETMRIAQELLSALQHAHERGVVHRDIKPANVLLLKDGTVKVADFGIAKFETSDLTQTGMVLGTVSHMSPEQLYGAAIDRRTDIFSSAIVLYQLLTGTPAFSGSTATVIQKVLNVMPPAPSTLLASVPPSLDAVILKAMAKSPEDRYATAGQFWNALSLAVTQAQSESDETERTIIQRVRRPALANSEPSPLEGLSVAAAIDPPSPVPTPVAAPISKPALPLAVAVAPRLVDAPIEFDPAPLAEAETSSPLRPPFEPPVHRSGATVRFKPLALVAGALLCGVLVWMATTRLPGDGAESREKPPEEHAQPVAQIDVAIAPKSTSASEPLVQASSATALKKPALPPAASPAPAPAPAVREEASKTVAKLAPEPVKPTHATPTSVASPPAPSTKVDTAATAGSPTASAACIEEAKRGDARCQMTLAGMYKTGRGVASNPQEALHWYKLAAEQGMASAQFEAASMLFHGQGVDKDSSQALSWAEKAGSQGLVAAQNLAGVLYVEQAKSDSSKYEKAVEWHQKAAAQGSGASMSSLANLTWYGRGTPKDTDKALDYWRAACDKNHTNSCFILGQIYAGGTRANPDEATRYYKRALTLSGLNDSDRSEAQAFLKRAP